MKSRIITMLVAFLAIAGNAAWGQGTSWTGQGTGTADDPYQISTPDELKAFRDLVNGGDADACAILKNDIELDSSEEWEPIMYKNQDASEAGYQGIFDGCGFSISGLYINQAATTSFSLTSFYGLFGIVGYAKIDFGGMGEIINTDAVIKNLTVKGSIDCYAAYISTGGIAGLNIATIQGCTNEVNLKDNHSSSSGSHTMGGICGNNSGSIISCVNKGNVESNTAGGICASNGGSIEKCCNEGTISGSIATGGISGQAAVGGTSSINNCYNEGYLNAKSGVVAGICAVLGNYMSSTTDVTITNCHNYGTITGDASKAGICTVYYREGNTNIEVTVSNNYYLDSTAEVGFLYTTDPGDEIPNDHPGQTEAKSEDEFANGEVLWLLQQNNPDVWVQTIEMDDYPKFETEGQGSTVYQVTVQPNDATMGTTAGGGIFQAGTEITVTATPNDGYEFINWTIGEEEQSTETTYIFNVTESVTLIANFQKIDEGGEEEPGDDQDTDQPGTIVKPIKYYNIYIDTICPGLNVEVSKDVVQEGHQVSAYLTIQSECDTTGMRFEYKRGLFGYWKDLKELEGVQPGEYIIKNIYTDIYIRALDATLPEEEPTGIEDVEGIKAYAKDGSIYVYTPNREEVTIIGMSGAIIKHAEQIGLQSYNVSRGIYIVRIGEKVFKLKN